MSWNTEGKKANSWALASFFTSHTVFIRVEEDQNISVCHLREQFPHFKENQLFAVIEQGRWREDQTVVKTAIIHVVPKNELGASYLMYISLSLFEEKEVYWNKRGSSHEWAESEKF